MTSWHGKRLRRSFSRLKDVAPLPDLVELQKKSYAAFLQKDVPSNQRAPLGLQGIFQDVFPVSDFAGKVQLEFCSYELEEPKYDIQEARQKGTNYASPLRVTFRLVVWDVDEETGVRVRVRAA